MTNTEIIDSLYRDRALPRALWRQLIAAASCDDREYARALAEKVTLERFKNRVYFRGIIEFSNLCKNDCLYCGIRRSNQNVHRYCLSPEQILYCCEEGYRLGYRTFVLQSGERAYTAEGLLSLIGQIKSRYSDCAVTVSVGECSREVYQAMYAAGADRYLLRHETANAKHYALLHPAAMSFENRMQCLFTLKEIGFQTGCGMMVGTPYQTVDCLVDDMLFMQTFQPAMVGLGPFIPHRDTPFAGSQAGNQQQTLFLLSLTRLMLPDALIPATTALATAESDGRVRGVSAGCNVVMPNLSLPSVRKDYMLYDNKAGTELDAQQSLQLLKRQMESVGRKLVTDRGDHKDYIKIKEGHLQ